MSDAEGSAMNEGRRESDHRFKHLEDTLKGHGVILKEYGQTLNKVDRKVHNGLSHSIEYIHSKVDKIEEVNDREHAHLSDNIKDLSKKFDKILWLVAVSSLSLIITQVIMPIIGG